MSTTKIVGQICLKWPYCSNTFGLLFFFVIFMDGLDYLLVTFNIEWNDKLLSESVALCLRDEEKSNLQNLIVAKRWNCKNHPQISYASPLDSELEWPLLEFSTVVFDGTVNGPINDTRVHDFEVYSCGLAGLDSDFLMIFGYYFAVNCR
jgi:hypothetical protein